MKRNIFIASLFVPILGPIQKLLSKTPEPKKYSKDKHIVWEYKSTFEDEIKTIKLNWVGINRNFRHLCYATDFKINNWIFRPKGEKLWLVYSLQEKDNMIEKSWLKEESWLEVYG